MPSDLLQGFWLGALKVDPLRGAITTPNDEVRHVEPKVMDVFVCLAEHANQLVTRDQLLEAVWHGQDVTDELVTRAIGGLRRALHDDRGDPQYIETVPKRGYRLIGQIRLPEGSELEKGLNRSLAFTLFNKYKLALVIGSAFVLALVYFAYDAFVIGRVQEEAPAITSTQVEGINETDTWEMSVAVLPFRNRSALPEDAYFVDGIQDDILTHLARLSFLEKVISRTSMEQYRETTKSMRQIGQELGVATILEGGVQRAGGRVRINVQLIDAATDEHLWVESYDRQLTAENIFAIQSEIATAIVDALQATLSAEDRESLTAVPTENMKALEYYFLGKDRTEKRTTSALAEAVDYFQAAIDLDSNFALAYVHLAFAIDRRRSIAGLSWDEEDP